MGSISERAKPGRVVPGCVGEFLTRTACSLLVAAGKRHFGRPVNQISSDRVAGFEFLTWTGAEIPLLGVPTGRGGAA
jgi:hypothetical protein